VGELVDLGAKYNVLQKSGSWFSYEGAKIGQGRDSVKALFESNPELAKEVEEKLYAAIKEDQEAKSAGAKKDEPQATPAPAVPATRAGARAKLDIVVDEDE